MQLSRILPILALSISALAQEPSKPRIADISAVPSDHPVNATGVCTASMSGYLLNKQGKKMTEPEAGKYLVSSLKDGYVITVYPETEGGIFVDMKCIATKPNAPARP
jgi:hypothetical protein